MPFRTPCHCIVASVLGILGSPVAEAQQPGNTGVGTQLADQITLSRLVDLASQRLRLNVHYNPADLSAAITLRLGAGSLTDEEFWDLTNQLLSTHQLTTVQTAADRGTLSVVKLAEAASVARVEFSPEEAAKSAYGPGFRAVVAKIANRNPREVADGLKPFLTKGSGSVAELPTGSTLAAAIAEPGAPVNPTGPGGAAGPGPQGGLILIADVAPRVEQALQLVTVLDTKSELAQVEEVPVRNLAPSQMATLAAQVATEQGAASGRKLQGKLIASPAGGSVLVVSPLPQLAYWRDLITQLDARQPVEVVTYSPKYFGIREVGRLIEQTVRDGASGAALGGASSPTDDRFKVVLDDLSGALIVTASPNQHERIRTLIDRLDNVPQAGRRPMRTFSIRNRPVKEIIDVVGRLIGLGVLDADPAGSTKGGSTPGEQAGAQTSGAGRDGTFLAGGSAASSPPGAPLSSVKRRQAGGDGSNTSTLGLSQPGAQAVGDALALTADEQTNTLIAVGEPRALTQLEGLLSTLDVRQPQVMLEVLLLTLSDSDAVKLGLELERLTSVGDTQVRLSSIFGLTTTGTGGRAADPKLQGGVVSVISPAEFSIVVNAVQSLGDSRGLTVPRLLVSNNQKGQFKSLSQAPIQSIATGANQITTTAFGGYEPAGTTVSVQPQIAEGDHLHLKCSISLSSFSDSSTAGLPPPRQENSLDSEATIPDAYTVVVGGIDISSSSKGTTQIPLLGDIPLIGEVFKNRSNDNRRSRFYAFIRAEVMRSTQFDDLKHVSSVAAEASSIDDGLPTVEPQVIR